MVAQDQAAKGSKENEPVGGAVFWSHTKAPHVAQSQLKLPPWRRHRVVILPSELNSDPRQPLPSRSQTAYPNRRSQAFHVHGAASTFDVASRFYGFQTVTADAND